MVEITCGAKARYGVTTETADFEGPSLNYTLKRKLMAASSGVVLKGFAFGIALGGLISGPPAFADQLNSHESPPPLTVPKATCGRGDHPETALQGQVPAFLRATCFKGFNRNLELVGQVRGDGANWQSDEFREQHGRGKGSPVDLTCAYHGTAFTTIGRTHLGVPVIDMTDPSAPVPPSYLTSISMLDPWESLKTNTRRELLAGDNAHNGGGGQGGP